MARSRRLFKLLCLLGLSATSACAQSMNASMQQDLDAGKVVVVIINAAEHRGSEQYADWSYYLNEFAASTGDEFAFHKIVTDDGSLESCPPAYREPYSTIFMRRGERSFVYPGPILEPQVYEYVRRAYSGEPIPSEVLAFAPEEVPGNVLKISRRASDGAEVLDCVEQR